MNILTNSLLWFAYFVSLYFAVFWLLVYLSKKTNFPQKKWSQLPTVSIVVPAYNEERAILRALKGLVELDYPQAKREIVVVDDGSTDATAQQVKQFIQEHPQEKIKLLKQANHGKGAALNRGIRLVTGEFFVCLDADSFVQKHTLKKLLTYFTDERIAAVLPALKVEAPQNTLQKLQWYEYIINLFYKELMGKLNCVHVTPGPFSIYRTNILRKVGGFDENNITEDLEMALRLQKENYKILQTVDSEVTTLAPASISTLYAQRNRWFKGSILNAMKYKSMLFNSKYGDFGMIQMPTIILSGIIALILLITIVYTTLQPAVMYLYHLSLVDFDIWTFLQNFAFNLKLLDLDYITIFVGFTMLSITLIVMKRSEVLVNERLRKYGSLPIIAYLILYFFFLAGVWVGVTWDLMRRKKKRW